MYVALMTWEGTRPRRLGILRLLHGRVVAEPIRPEDLEEAGPPLDPRDRLVSPGPTHHRTAASHPEPFLLMLHREFRSAYFWATKAQELPLPSSPCSLTAIWQSLTARERQWFSNMVEAWGPEKVLASWESLRYQLEWARDL